MIGIDIVDLKDPLFRQRTKRSLDLIITEKDQSIDHPHLFWLFWSAKEAVFKSKREIKSFTPREIPITLTMKGSKIIFESEGIKGEILAEKDYVLAIAGTNEVNLVHAIVSGDGKCWSKSVRKKIKSHFSKQGISASISKSGNLPTLNDRHPISISHHGQFAAFVYPKTFLSA